MRRRDSFRNFDMSARSNPYRVECLHALLYLDRSMSVPALQQRFRELDCRAAIVGPHGHGKTTLLLELMQAFQQAGQPVHALVLHSHDQACTHQPARLVVRDWLQQAQDDQILVLDGAEQLGSWTWRTVLRRARTTAGLLITSHRAGRLPTLHVCRTSPELLSDLIGRLNVTDLQSIDCHQLWKQHRGNVRNCLRSLYDGWKPHSGKILLADRAQ